jgi:hypothetical protein
LPVCLVADHPGPVGVGAGGSSGVTTQAAPAVPPVVVVAPVVVVGVALVGDELQPATKAAPAKLSASIMSRGGRPFTFLD